ncbi:MAG: sensor domain-containing protein [Trinickia sp.]|uniref:sensor domain-containing protein n=1 Tax=Trinickia sp. TaxID=2571163 RepID=UPI003F7FC672
MFDIVRLAEQFLGIAAEIDVLVRRMQTDEQAGSPGQYRPELMGLSSRLRVVTEAFVSEAEADRARYAQMSEALFTSERQAHSLADNLPANVARWDRTGRYLYVNAVLERTLMKSAAQLIGTEIRSTHAAIAAAVAHVAATGEPVPCVGQTVLGADGEPRWHEVSLIPERDDRGEVVSVLAIGCDVTERKHVETMLAEREKEFRTLVEHSPDIIIRYDRALRRVYVNPIFAALAGGEGGAAGLIGKRPRELPLSSNAILSGGVAAMEYEAKLDEVFRTGKNLEFEASSRWHADGSPDSCYLVKMAPEFGEDGTVESVLAVARDITELNASRKHIEWMAYHDPLTSASNRAYFSESLRKVVTAPSAGPKSLAAVMMVDMDRFKDVNDTMGHAVGDEMLREVARRLRACVRAEDVVARFGGDEFSILLPNAESRADIERIAQRIIERFNQRFVLDGTDVFVSCSIGIAIHPTDSTSADDLIKYADSAMYLAKRSGRRGFRFYAKDLTRDAAARLGLESQLHRAIEHQEFELHYHPKISLKDRTVVGSEALLRWNRPGGELVMPNTFIPIAEESGLIVDLGKWVLHEACLSAIEWNRNAAATHKVAINLSARQFQSVGFGSTIAGVLEETGCRPEWLEFEITESILLEENDAVLTTLGWFRKMGVSIAIDDFGTGYSSLSYLARFPIDVLKIDRTFVQKVAVDRRHAELVKAILSIARCFGQQVVAEGVETLEQANFLERNGCPIAQGFLYSKPLRKREMSLLPRCLDGIAPDSNADGSSAPVGSGLAL